MAGGRVVLPGWHTGNCHAVLSGASAPGATGAADHARGRGRQFALADAHPAARGRARARQRVSPAPAQGAGARSSAPLRFPIRIAIAHAPAAAAMFITSASGTRRPIPRRTSRRLSRCGSSHDPTGARSYADWPAFDKLSLVDELMTSVRGQPAGGARPQPGRAASFQYAHSRAALSTQARASGPLSPGVADELLIKVFSAQKMRANAPRASTLYARGARRAGRFGLRASSASSDTPCSSFCACSSSAARS